MIGMLALATAVATVSPSASPVPAAAAAYYSRALARLNAMPSSPYAEYSMHQVRPGRSFTYEVRERRADRASWNLVIQVDRWKRIGQVEIGRHYLIPDAFLPLAGTTVRRQARGILPDLGGETGPMAAGTAPPLRYDVRLIDLGQLAGCGYAAHLGLSPTGDAETYNVREMWVRASDGALCRAVYNSYLFEPQGNDAKIRTIVDARVNDLGLVTSWQSHYVIGRDTFPLDGTFSDVVWMSTLAPYYFDQQLWTDHQRAAQASRER